MPSRLFVATHSMGSPASEIQFSRLTCLPASDAAPASPNRQTVNRQTIPDIAQSAALGRTQKPNFRNTRSTVPIAAASSNSRTGPPAIKAE